MVMAQSLFIVLRQREPDCSIDVLAPSWSRPLLERMPEIENPVDLPFGHGQLRIGERWRLGKSLIGREYDRAILLPNTLKSAIVPFAARIPRRTGWRGEMRYGLLNDLRHLDKKRLRTTVRRFVALACEPGEDPPTELPRPRLSIESAGVASALASLGLTRPRRPLLALCPGAEYGPAKRWPVEHYAQLAVERALAGWAVWLFGSAKDKPVCAEVARMAGGGSVDLSGHTTLAQAVDLLSLADAVITNDSGLMHVAAALDRRIVAIYGSSDPAFTPPLSGRSRVLWRGLECSPCFKRECPLGHLDCLRTIGVAKVQEALEDLL